MSHFNEAVESVLRAEGGLLISNSEHGGGANFGVSLTVLQEYRRDKTLTLEDLKKLTIDEAKAIYKKRYWDRILGDQIKGRLTAILLLDQAVNRGVSGVINLLIGTLTRHYKWKAATIDEAITLINKVEDRSFFRRFLCDVQHAYVDLCQASPSKAKWLKGWLTRTHNLMKLLI